jgi:uncharacterized membrane protein
MESFLPLLILLLVWSDRQNLRLLYWCTLIIALAVKEDVGVYIFGLAVYMFIAEKKRARGMLTAAACILWVSMALEWIIPHFSHSGDDYKFISRWSHWGGSPLEILWGFILQPLDLIRAVISKTYLHFFLCILFLPFFHFWGWIPIIVPLLITSTSSSVLQAELGLYYGIPLFTFVVISIIPSFQSGTFKKISSSPIAPYLIALVIVLNVAHFTFPLIPRDRFRIVKELHHIPEDATIQTMSCFYPVLGYERSKEVIYDSHQDLTAEHVILRDDSNTWPLSKRAAGEMVKRIAASQDYENLSAVESFYIFHKIRDRTLHREMK